MELCIDTAIWLKHACCGSQKAHIKLQIQSMNDSENIWRKNVVHK